MKNFKIKLDFKKCTEFRNIITSNVEHLKDKVLYDNDKNIWHWNSLCSILDRIYDTTRYLNNLELNKENNEVRNAFDFYDFIINAQILINNIYLFSEIFKVNISDIKDSSEIFNETKGTDDQYFKYLRALLSVHPENTTSYSIFRVKDSKYECCPCLTWNNGMLDIKRKGDLYAKVYSNIENYEKHIDIYMNLIFAYIENRYNIIDKILLVLK